MDLDKVVDELYTVPPSDFVQRRNELASMAQRAGDKTSAATIKKLRKPTLGAWLANLLVREQGDLIDELLQLGATLRTAQLNLAGAELRRLVQKRREVIGSLVTEARGLARHAGQPVSDDAARELEATLAAALADEPSGDALRSGQLTSALSHVGFGPLERDLGESGQVASPDQGRSRPSAKTRSRSDERRVERRAEAERAVRGARAAVSDLTAALADQKDRLVDLQRERDQRRVEVRDLERRLDVEKTAATSSEHDTQAAQTTSRETDRKLKDAEAHLARAITALDRLGT